MLDSGLPRFWQGSQSDVVKIAAAKRTQSRSCGVGAVFIVQGLGYAALLKRHIAEAIKK